MYPFSGQLINGHESYQWLKNAFKGLTGEALFCGAFLKEDVLIELKSLIPTGGKIKVLTRWQLGDLIAGASDLLAYEICKKNGWQFHIKLNFHGKVFLVPNSGILVGSANPTLSGFGLKPNSNSEVGTIVNLTSNNIDVVNNLFNKSTLVDDGLYEKLKVIVNSHKDNKERIVWPKSILNQIENNDFSDEKLFTTECFITDGVEILRELNFHGPHIQADLSLLGIYGETDKDLAVELFLDTKIYKWLNAVIMKNGGSMSFGGVTAALHNALLDDPTPYRSEVKKLVQNIFSWISIVGVNRSGIELIKPNHAQVLKIV
jgi:hypothetical protein